MTSSDRASLRYSGSEPDIQVVGHASRATLGIQLTLELRGQVVLLDMDMPDIDGVSAIRAILAEAPQTRVIALSADESGERKSRMRWRRRYGRAHADSC